MTNTGSRTRLRIYLWIAASAMAAVWIALVWVNRPSSDRPGVTAVPTLRRGETAPAFDLPDLRNPDRRVRLADHRGATLLVNFFDSTCTSCVREMPVLDDLARSGVIAVIGVDLLDRRADAMRLVSRTGVTYPIGFDDQGVTLTGYRTVSLPTTVVIGPDGRVRDVFRRPITKEDGVRASRTTSR